MSRFDSVRRSDSVRRAGRPASYHPDARHSQLLHLEAPDLERMQKSTTGHLRTFSKLAESTQDEFEITSEEQQVVGLAGRRRLQRAQSTRGAPTWQASNWMDKQRQYLAAYEYLCHIGEAKEWIEGIIDQELPPIIMLEDALRDGVTLAELVQALQPDKHFRIFRHPRLQYRHSDNIAIFFRFAYEEAGLDKTYHFELVDLYEKKNIPKVIHCIHALAWMLWKNGKIDLQIGNLVGQLQFDDHDLEATQRSLDRSGIAMPNFSGMSANFGVQPEPEPEPEPVETDEERWHREGLEVESMIVDLQAAARGALARGALHGVLLDFWETEDAEEGIVELQAIIKGQQAREIAEYHLLMFTFARDLQCLSRGFIARQRRSREEAYISATHDDFAQLQSLIRARKLRSEVRSMSRDAQRNSQTLADLQSVVRGLLTRWRVSDQYYEAKEGARTEIVGFQALAKRKIAKCALEEQRMSLRVSTNQVAVSKIQSMVRAKAARTQNLQVQYQLAQFSPKVEALQSLARAAIRRESTRRVEEELDSQQGDITQLQALAKARLSKSDFNVLQFKLQEWTPTWMSIQSISRAHLKRNQIDVLKSELANPRRGPRDHSTETLQAVSRGALCRRRLESLLDMLESHEPSVTDLQAIAFGNQCRDDINSLLDELYEFEDDISALASHARGKIHRDRYAEKMAYYRSNMQKVIKVQSFARAKAQGSAYKTLISGTNPPVGTLKQFVHLLNDNDFDFDEEIEFERLRKTVVHKVRQNELTEQYVEQLDVKIALLVRNKITLDEVLKAQKKLGGHFPSNMSSMEMLSSTNPFDLKALNARSREKLELYQELFFILQTQSQYLARVLRTAPVAASSKETISLESLTMSLFGLATKRREEYYLIKLLTRANQEEITHSQGNLDSYIRNSKFWIKIFEKYVRTPKDRRYLKETFGPMIEAELLENEGLDLEHDPLQIYRTFIKDFELRTGQVSDMNPNITRENAIRTTNVRKIFTTNMTEIRDITDGFLLRMQNTIQKMPFGVRYIARSMWWDLADAMPHEDPGVLLRVVGQWVWKHYLGPSLAQPEQWGVVDRGLSPLNKKNLSTIAKVLNQIAMARPFSGDDVLFKPLDKYITEVINTRVTGIWERMVDVPDVEQHFDLDEFNDLYSKNKPTLHIKASDIFAIHDFVQPSVNIMCPDKDDYLRGILRDLGSAAQNQREMGKNVNTQEISLQLSGKYHAIEDPDASIKLLFTETKRMVLYIIRVQQGNDLFDILKTPVKDTDLARWNSIIREERIIQQQPKKRQAYSGSSVHENDDDTPHPTARDLTRLPYTELKAICLQNIIRLESAGRIKRDDKFQDILNAIARDIRTKHQRRLERARDMESIKSTLEALETKQQYLDDQLTMENDYLEQAMLTLTKKNANKSKFYMPFTKQYNHQKELERKGVKPKFGSYKYSARNLAEKGVLIAWRGYADQSNWHKIDITLSCDAVGLFTFEASKDKIMLQGCSAVVPLDEILQAQFNNCQYINLFDEQGKENSAPVSGGKGGEGAAQFNVNLLVHLLMRKFYRDQ
ncbi:putative ras GTPase activating protein [Aulographum hederae CBS 113979]|uniref:Putative ras GTPase activating protein n=1 Tax=Aulographum hederae CBS 113979 TaxID=1176131 RepID=A0A6G1HB27_9PEZI|nr:putative ras GTPase activating protein [Aulographum hederae CBS 113979]